MLRSLIFLEQKSNGKIKGRSCADGRRQWEIFSKNETTSLTAMNKNLFQTTTINAYEGCDVATVDIPGAFLHTEVDPNNDMVHMTLRGTLAELIEKYAVCEGKNMVYVEIQKALYGMLKSALLFYLKLVGDLENAGFKLNPYDPCIVNNTVFKSRLTFMFMWHVNDTKLSHKNPKVVTKFISYLNGFYLGVTVHRGCVHGYLGMILYSSTWKEVHVSMTYYLIKVKRLPRRNRDSRCHTGSQVYVQRVRQLRSKEAGRETGSSVPPCRCTIAFCYKSMPRHSNGNCFSFHESKIPQQGQLGETKASDWLRARHNRFEIKVLS
ncbi:hypothetical protein ACHAWF_013877 [Thalassiosira exigua]